MNAVACRRLSRRNRHHVCRVRKVARRLCGCFHTHSALTQASRRDGLVFRQRGAPLTRREAAAAATSSDIPPPSPPTLNYTAPPCRTHPPAYAKGGAQPARPQLGMRPVRCSDAASSPYLNATIYCGAVRPAAGAAVVPTERLNCGQLF